MAVETLFLAALAFAGGDHTLNSDKLKQKDELIASLFDLQRRVRAGELPPEGELALGRVSRERILAGLDVRVAKGLGIDPSSLRNRLIPGFSAELDQLVKRQPTHDLAPSEEPSPLLTLVLDVEQQLFAAADRKRQRAGIKSPIDSGPLSQKLEAPGPMPSDEQPKTASASVAATSARIGAVTKGVDPAAVGKALYRSGRFADALKAWEAVRFDDPKTSLELHYIHADALFRSGRTEEAIKAWEKLAGDHAETSYGQQADFSLKIARTIVALNKARPEEGAASKDAKAAGDAKEAGKSEKKPERKGDAKSDAARAKDGEGHGP